MTIYERETSIADFPPDLGENSEEYQIDPSLLKKLSELRYLFLLASWASPNTSPKKQEFKNPEDFSKVINEICGPEITRLAVAAGIWRGRCFIGLVIACDQNLKSIEELLRLKLRQNHTLVD